MVDKHNNATTTNSLIGALLLTLTHFTQLEFPH